MVTSMTGYGKAKSDYNDGVVSVEIKSFNHKYFEISPKLPEPIQPFEEQIKKTLKNYLRRGKVYVWVNYEPGINAPEDIMLDEQRLKRYVTLMKTVKKKFGLTDDISLAQLMALPNVIIFKHKKESKKKLWQAVLAALETALQRLCAMRKKEGTALYRDLADRITQVSRAVKDVEQLVPECVEDYRRKLADKAPDAGEKISARNEERQNLEVATFARNCDISEELTRLDSHVEHFRQVLDSGKEAGKVLDFIAQEMQREINTAGAKSVDVRIARQVIFVKGEIEKIREQVQNIE